MSKVLDSWCAELEADLISAFETGPEPAVFVGSGFGQEAIPSLSTVTDLVTSLRAELKVNDASIGLAELLQYYKNRHAGSNRSVRAWLEARLNWGGATASEPGGAHHILLRLPFKLLLTTNYDNLFDRAASRTLLAGYWTATSSIDEFNQNSTSAPATGKACAHIHGAFSIHATSPIVATTDDYIEVYRSQQGWLYEVEQMIRHYRFVFIGYSMRDFTTWSSYFSTILKHPNDMWPHTMVCPSTCEHERRFWSEYNIQFVPLRAYQFLIALCEKLRLLSRVDIAAEAAAACWKITPEAARPRFEAMHNSLGYPNYEFTVRHIIDATH
jgi:hypothetical protein